MTVFDVLTLLGGLALFLYGMTTMGDGLVRLSGGRLEKILEKLTSKRIMALLLGTMVTAVIQSSSATTVMVVGFVNSGIMKLSQAVGIIMGANIGTTVTSWLLSLTGISGSSFFIKMLKPSSFSPILAVIGIIMVMTAKEDGKRKDIGTILLGFATLMFGMETMSDSVSPLKESASFTSLFTAFSNPILGMIAGAVLTAIIQSSSASVGILQALCATGAVSFGAAIPIIMGQNIGTCVTALISSIGASRNAKRASMIHLLFNLIGTILFMLIFYFINSFVHFRFLAIAASPAGIALIHSCFNIACTIVLFPFANGLVKLATLIIPEKNNEKGTEKERRPETLSVLDERFLEQPAFAMHLCKKAVEDMSCRARDAFELAMEVLQDYDEDKVKRVIQLEQDTDLFEDTLDTYLVKLSARKLSPEDSRTLSILLHSIGNFERIADHAINLTESAGEISQRTHSLTRACREEFAVYCRAIRDVMDLTVSCFASGDLQAAKRVEPIEEVVDRLSIQMKKHHIQRLRSGDCSIGTGLIYEDILTDCERVSDHCSNVAVCIIEVKQGGFEAHEYLNEVIKARDPAFREELESALKRYILPSGDESV